MRFPCSYDSLTFVGNARNRDFQAISWLDPRFNGHQHVPNVGLSPPVFYGA